MKSETYVQTPTGEVYRTSSPEFWKDAKVLTQAEGKRLQCEQAKKHLRKILRPGDTVYTILRHVSSSGMSRRIDLAIANGKRGEIACITHQVALACGNTIAKNGGIQVGGCGMDMGFHLVYNLGYCLWPKGTRKPHGTRNGEPDKDGGYALKHRWL